MTSAITLERVFVRTDSPKLTLRSPSSDDEDGNESLNCLKRIDAINLILPAELSATREVRDEPISPNNEAAKSSSDRTSLRGYQTLQELREKVSTFRQGNISRDINILVYI